MNPMSTTEESIQQLHDTTIQHQTAINSIQATLAVQQNDIAAIKTSIIDIRLSINNIIHSLSDITAKLGFQITLPPPLPLSPTPPTPPRLAAVAPPTLPPVAVDAASFTTPSFPLDATSPAPPALTLTPPSSPYAIGSGKTAITGVDEFGMNSEVVFFQVLDARPAMNHAWLNEQKWVDARNMFVEMIKPSELSFQLATIIDNNAYPHLVKLLPSLNTTNAYSQNWDDRKPLIFDPGGKMDFESLFVVRFMRGDDQLNYNPNSTISISLQPTYDLEDKVIFERSVMIRIILWHQANLTVMQLICNKLAKRNPYKNWLQQFLLYLHFLSLFVTILWL